MKYSLFFLFAFATILFARPVQAQQAPAGINYQAVLRNSDGAIVADRTVDVRLSIVDVTTDMYYYTEKHRVQTSNVGIMNLVIGEGVAELGTFKGIPWGGSDLWLEVGYDLDNSGDYAVSGATRLLSVPYALYAAKAGAVTEKPGGTPEAGGTLSEEDVWGTKGNLYIDDKFNFLGTVNYADLIVKTNNLERMRLTREGQLIVLESATFEADVAIQGNTQMQANAQVANDLQVGADAQIGGELRVLGRTYLNDWTEVHGMFQTFDDGQIGEDLNVVKDLSVGGDGKFTNDVVIHHDLDVDNNLNVDNDGHFGNNVDIDNSLNVDVNINVGNDGHFGHNVDIDNDLNVDHNAHIGGDLDVDGTGTFYDMLIEHNLTVGNDAQINHNLTVENTITGNHRLVINAGVDGDDGDIDNYPVLVQGGSQGIAVKVNGGRDASNNFVSFWDNDGMQGRIEGQTQAEVAASFEYVWTNTIFTIDAVALAADIVGLGTELATVEAQVLTAAEGVGIAAQIVAATAEAVSLAAQLVEYNTNAFLNAGVAYESGSGDYAEWLERAPGESDLNFGEIVGVRGGVITRNTAGADHYMVISKAPIVLGNMPQPGEEARYEKVAFMGQVPVRVVGKVNVGDYILPSGNHDGLALAVAPAAMKIGDYARIVGVSWQSAPDAPLNIVNVAVGINSNDLATRIDAQQRQLDQLDRQMHAVLAYLQGSAPMPVASEIVAEVGEPVAAQPVSAAPAPVFSSESFDRLMDTNADLIARLYADVAAALKEKGFDVNAYPQTQAYFADPVGKMKELRRDPLYKTQWSRFDQTILERIKR